MENLSFDLIAWLCEEISKRILIVENMGGKSISQFIIMRIIEISANFQMKKNWNFGGGVRPEMYQLILDLSENCRCSWRVI
jgi:hypothetical protein